MRQFVVYAIAGVFAHGCCPYAQAQEAGLPDAPSATAARSQADGSSITVTATMKEVAAAEVATEEKQRVLGVIPNFYVVYSPQPTPLSSGQKFHLAFRSTIDPVNLLLAGATAGVEQANGSFAGYGQGAAGFGKRYGSVFADGAISTFLGGAVLPSLLRQDPRYFYQGTGTTRSRARHAIASVFVCRGDNGKQQFNFSNILGNFASAGISNLYYPASDRNGAGLTLRNAAVGTGFSMVAALMQEFVVPRFTPHLPGKSSPTPHR